MTLYMLPNRVFEVHCRICKGCIAVYMQGTVVYVGAFAAMHLIPRSTMRTLVSRGCGHRLPVQPMRKLETGLVKELSDDLSDPESDRQQN